MRYWFTWICVAICHLAVILTACPVFGVTLHVAASGDNSAGSTWDTAYHKIGDAILASATGDSIWVKEGVYGESASIRHSVAIYGGFDGTETSADFDLRDPAANQTVIDGEDQGSVISISAPFIWS